MTTLDAWRQELKSDLATFAPLAKEDRGVDLIFGITAAAVLWRVRNAPSDDVQKAALREACGDDTHLAHLLEALSGWDEFTPLEASRALSKRQSIDDTLRESLTVLMGAFVEVLLAEKMLQTQTITIEGSVHGANINIGGYQVFTGETIIQYTRPVVSTCPTAPKPPDHFTGREQELRDLREKLTGDNVVAITAVRAMGGMGKTTLAQALCHQPDKPFDAVLWASLGENPQTTSILMEWAQYAVDHYSLKPDARPEEIAGWVRGQLTKLMHKSDGCGEHWLVVFDDVWNKPTSYAAVELLQTALPAGIKTLITTRQVDTASYLRATSIELYELSSKDALTLLQRLRDNRHLNDAHLQRAVDIIKGHPLTLEIAIASLNDAEDAEDISAILDEYERGVRDGSPFDALNLDVETPRILNVVFGRSYSALPADDQVRFRALGIMPPGAIWNRRLAGSLWDVEEQRALTQAHKTLRLASFIQQDEAAEYEYGEVYYRQHPLLRAYARALLDQEGESAAVFGSYTDYVIEQAQQFQQLPLEAWGLLESLLPHVDHVGDALVAQYAPMEISDEALLKQAEEFAYAATRYVHRRPLLVVTENGKELRGLRWLEMGLAISRFLGNHQRSAFYFNAIGFSRDALGEVRKALKYYQQGLRLYREASDKRGEGATLNNIGGAWDTLGEKRKALNFYQQALLISREAGDKLGEATTLNNIGLAWSSLGEMRKALDFYQQALLIDREVGEKGSEATVLSNIGLAWNALGEAHKALDFYDKALSLNREVGDKWGEALTLNCIGSTWYALGEACMALDFYQPALQLKRAVGDKGGEAATLNNIGLAWFDLNEALMAMKFYDEALSLIREVGDKRGEAATLHNIGSAWSALGEKRKALDFYQQALPLKREVGDRRGEATTLNNIGLTWAELGEERKALEFLQQALSLIHEVGDKSGEASTLFNMSLLVTDTQQAFDYVQQAHDLWSAIRSPKAYQFAIPRLMQLHKDAESPSEEAQAIEFRRYFTTEYGQKAADVVRQMLKEQVPDELIEKLIGQLAAAAETPGSSTQSMLPEETVMEFADKSIAVMTTEVSELNAWREYLQNARQSMNNMGERWHTEVAFADALLSILDGGSPVLPGDNPYAAAIQSIVREVEKYKKENNS